MAAEPTAAAPDVLVAGPNLTVDRTVRLEQLRPGQVLRADQVSVTPGGKGLNVARAVGTLERQAALVGFVPGRTGAAAAGMITDEGVALAEVSCAGEVRSAAVLRERDGRTTVVNEPGPPVTASDWSRYEAAVEDELERGAGALVCSGSCPPGAPDDAYARLVGQARNHGVMTVLDAAGRWLAGGLAAAPDVVTPNLAEAETLLDGDDDEPTEAGPDAPDRAVRAAAALHARGVGAAVVTAADAGVALATSQGRWWVPTVRVSVRNPVGAGDAFAAALTLALLEGRSLPRACQAGVATAAASVEIDIAGHLDAERVGQLQHQVAHPRAV